MHAGKATNDSVQRAHGDKFLAATAKTIMPASSLPNIYRGRTILFLTAPKKMANGFYNGKNGG